MALSLLEPWMLTNPFHKVIDNDNNAQEVVYEDIDDLFHTETVRDPGLLAHVI